MLERSFRFTLGLTPLCWLNPPSDHGRRANILNNVNTVGFWSSEIEDDREGERVSPSEAQPRPQAPWRWTGFSLMQANAVNE